MGARTSKLLSSISRHSSTKQHGLRLFLLENLKHLPKREGAAHIGVEDKESFGVSFEYGITEVIEASSGSECSVFTQVADF
jgi:hypothetical protein